MSRKIAGMFITFFLSGCTTHEPKLSSDSSLPIETYNYDTVCEDSEQYIHHLESFITKKEWSDIKAGRYMKKELFLNPSYLPSQQIYINLLNYSHNGLDVTYVLTSEELQIWNISFSTDRIPTELQKKEYFISRYEVKAPYASLDTLQVGCDAFEMTIEYNKNKAKKLIVEVNSGVI